MHPEMKKTVEGLTAAAIDNSSATTLKEVATSTMPDIQEVSQRRNSHLTLQRKYNHLTAGRLSNKEIIKANTFDNPIYISNERNQERRTGTLIRQ